MRKKLFLFFPAIVGMAVGSMSLTGCVGDRSKKDKFDKDGKLILNLRNLYFNDFYGGDIYTNEIEEKFQIKIQNPGSYSWTNWMTQVSGEVLSDNVPDVFHANVDSYNFASSYKFWAEEEIAKQIPDDLTKWPNLKKMIENTTNIDSLKVNGHLYGIPIAKNTTDYTTTYSPFTYVYRRDWAKQWGVYQANDEYTWEQFQTLLDTFTKEGKKNGGDKFALGDVEWGFPSITNFYKQVPHCFAQDASGKYVNNYTTDAYLEGLEMSKTFKQKGWYGYPQYSALDGDLNKEFVGNRCGVLYENLSYSNYYTLRDNLTKTNILDTSFNVDEAVGIMKVKGPDGKYVLEGTDNWFSMTFLDFRMSENKMNKLLDLFDWLLSDEGTRFSVYGIEDYDYTMNGDEVELVEKSWTKDPETGLYAAKVNGGKYLRQMVSLGYDTLNYDPLTDKSCLSILNNWDAEMKAAGTAGTLKVLKENAEVMWLTTPKKAEFSGYLRTEALKAVTKYIYGDISSLDAFKKAVESNDAPWASVLKEINDALGK